MNTEKNASYADALATANMAHGAACRAAHREYDRATSAAELAQTRNFAGARRALNDALDAAYAALDAAVAAADEARRA
jgi:hypothetical protein